MHKSDNVAPDSQIQMRKFTVAEATKNNRIYETNRKRRPGSMTAICQSMEAKSRCLEDNC